MCKSFHFLLKGEASWIHYTERSEQTFIYARVGSWVWSVVQILFVWRITKWLKRNDFYLILLTYWRRDVITLSCRGNHRTIGKRSSSVRRHDAVKMLSTCCPDVIKMSSRCHQDILSQFQNLVDEALMDMLNMNDIILSGEARYCC